jgi:hypothetical protein
MLPSTCTANTHSVTRLLTDQARLVDAFNGHKGNLHTSTLADLTRCITALIAMTLRVRLLGGRLVVCAQQLAAAAPGVAAGDFGEWARG